MPVEVPIQQMSLPQKLELMEALWDNLCREPEKVPSPDWHKEVLEERRHRLASGEEMVSDWEAAKADIRRRIS
jgi:putative addiction module component (TIGR02574 family)